MATIGQVLTAPESGYQRIDDNHESIKYIDILSQYNDRASNYNKTVHYMKANSGIVEFTFKGTKLTLTGDAINTTGISNNIEVYIDGVLQGVYTQRLGSTTWSYQVTWFTKTGLEDKSHTVKIVNKGSEYFTLDTIDIDVNGYFGTINKFLILSNDNYLSIEKKYLNSNAIPIMISNTNPSGIASASRETSGYEAYKAFDGITTSSNGWYSGVTATVSNPSWLSYEFNTNKSIWKYELFPRSNALTASPSNWTLEGSNDGTNWTILDTQTGISNWQANTEKTFIITNPSNYKIYRIVITNGSTIGELKMYELVETPLRIINSLSEQNFIDYGVNKLSEIDLISQITNKVFIEQNSTTVGSGKVFSKTIDTTKTPIKKVSIN